jgi:hypothetical protein
MLLSIGIACVLASIVGGGVKGLGFEFPPLQSTRRQVLLGCLGIVFIVLSQAGSFRAGPAADTTSAPPVPEGRRTAPGADSGGNPPIAARRNQDNPIGDEQPGGQESIIVGGPGGRGASVQQIPADTPGAAGNSPDADFKPCLAGTNYVMVDSGVTDLYTAKASVDRYRQHFPQFAFKLFRMNDYYGREAYIVLAGHGLNTAEAERLMARLRMVGLASSFSRFMQDSQPLCLSEL